jgi:hypothetical protein
VTTEPRRRAAFGRPVAAVLLVLVATALTFLSTAFPQEPDGACPGYGWEETTTYELSYSLWPPGVTDCEYTTPAGEVKRSTYVPWKEWLVIAILLWAAGLAFSWALTLRSPALRWLVFAVVTPPTVIVVIVFILTSPLLPPLLLAGGMVWWIRRRR